MTSTVNDTDTSTTSTTSSSTSSVAPADGPGQEGWGSTIALLWGEREPSGRGPKPAFTVGDIAVAAVRVADADGIAAVSMQRVAGELGYTKMSLYRYVSSKAELLAVMTEEAIGPPPDLSSIPGGWRRRAEAWARLMWETWDRHPWIPGATTGARPVGPREVGWSEAVVAAFAGSGLPGADQMNAAVLLSGHVRNTYSPGAAGTQPWTAGHALDPVLARLIKARADRFPAIMAATAAPGRRPQEARQFGLSRILDGIELLVGQR
jgi:AcrR family transcriptional regulator